MATIWLTGDTHSDVRRLNNESFYEQKEFSNQDENFVIILGDFGLVWEAKESKNETYWLNWLEYRNFTTLFCDGNHENFDRLNSMPVTEWHGGNVHQIRPHVFHLMRGQVFNILGKKFFTFGGARSHDINNGILDVNDPEWKEKAKELRKDGKYMYRVKGLSWWEQELPTKEEMQTGYDNLATHDYTVDYILTHSPCTSDLYFMRHGSRDYKPDILTDYLEDVRGRTDYKKWYFGHMHENRVVSDKGICLYEQIMRIG